MGFPDYYAKQNIEKDVEVQGHGVIQLRLQKDERLPGELQSGVVLKVAGLLKKVYDANAPGQKKPEYVEPLPPPEPETAEGGDDPDTPGTEGEEEPEAADHVEPVPGEGVF